MKRIWKWELSPEVTLDMPKGATILAVQPQHDIPCMWALVDPKAFIMKRKFKIYGTGHDMPNYPGEYIGTFQIHDGSLVFHVFEIT